MAITAKDRVITFTRTKATLADEPVEKELLTGHVCPNCKSVVQALFLNDGKRIPLDLVAEPTERHQVVPKYDYERIVMQDGRQADFIREKFHLGLETLHVYGKCKYQFAVHFPAPPEVNPVPWVAGCMSFLHGTKKSPGYIPRNWLQFTKVFKSGGDARREMCRVMWFGDHRGSFTGSVTKKIAIAEEVTGTCPPLVLLTRFDWGHWDMEQSIRFGIQAAEKLEKEKASTATTTL